MIVVKIGGRFAEDDGLVSALADELGAMKDQGKKIVLVHGGGSTITRLQELFGIKAQFSEGLRQTSADEMPMVDMALAGAVNKHLVRLFQSQGINAWGLSGADARTIMGRSVAGRTAKVHAVNSRAIKLLWLAGYFPILAPPSMDSEGRALNINADEVALALAESLAADRLIFISDVPGVLCKGETIRELSIADIEALIDQAIIKDGMVPKVRSAAKALESGVGAVHIASYKNPGDLGAIFCGKSGTKIFQGG